MRDLLPTSARMNVTALAQEAAQHLDFVKNVKRDLHIILMKVRTHLDQTDATLTVSAQALEAVLQQDTATN